jgi:hypothetical protein
LEIKENPKEVKKMKGIVSSLLALFMVPAMVLAMDVQIFTSTNSELPNNQLYCIAFDNDGNAWFGGQKDASSGLAFVSSLSADLQTWTVYDPADLKMDLTEERAFYIAVDNQNTKWFCTHYGVNYLKADGTADTVGVVFDHYTRTVFTDPAGKIYISDRDAPGIYVSEDNGASWALWSAEDIALSTGRPEIYDLRVDSQGQMWVCTWYGVVYRDTEGVWHEVDDLAGEYTFAMTVSADDKKYVAMHIYDGGDFPDKLAVIDAEGAVSYLDSTDYEPLKAMIWDLEMDSEGNLWLALEEGGLMKLKTDGSYEMITAEDGLPEENITHMEIKDDVIWASTANEGLVHISGIVTSNKPIITPVSHLLSRNYPNPFNPQTNIQFTLPENDLITVAIYDAQGALVKKLAEATPFSAGENHLSWNGTDLNNAPVASGVYFCKISSSTENSVTKMMLMK